MCIWTDWNVYHNSGVTVWLLELRYNRNRLIEDILICNGYELMMEGIWMWRKFSLQHRWWCRSLSSESWGRNECSERSLWGYLSIRTCICICMYIIYICVYSLCICAYCILYRCMHIWLRCLWKMDRLFQIYRLIGLEFIGEIWGRDINLWHRDL